MCRNRATAPLLTILLLLAGARHAAGYAVLTHEAVIDSAWDTIKPILLHRFPASTPDDLKKAHAYTYGGCIIQDMGYYPFGSFYFSDLVHYVRSGDFVMALIRDAQDLNELAFALGALAHYAADNQGHPIATNRAVALAFPKLRAHFGNLVTYADNPVAHLKTEFGFDVVEVAQGNYASEDYHDFIGFQVSKELLERAFQETYGLELKKQFTSLDLALGSYRYTVSSLLPTATEVAWSQHKNDIVKAHPGMTKRKFLYNVRRSSYEQEWGKEYERPGSFARFLAFLFRIVPKVGPFKGLALQLPTAQTEALFMQSFNKTLELYRANLRDLSTGTLRLENMDFDTGKPSRPGEYSLADYTYGRLLRELRKKNFQGMTAELRANLLEFYTNPKPFSTGKLKGRKSDAKTWQETLAAAEQLRTQQAANQSN